MRRKREDIEEDLRDRCCWMRCRNVSDMIYVTIGLCQHHWEMICNITWNRAVYPTILTHVTQAAAHQLKEEVKRTGVVERIGARMKS